MDELRFRPLGFSALLRLCFSECENGCDDFPWDLHLTLCLALIHLEAFVASNLILAEE
jgi:hypothetical protein